MAFLDHAARTIFLTEILKGMAMTLKYFFKKLLERILSRYLVLISLYFLDLYLWTSTFSVIFGTEYFNIGYNMYVYN